MKNAFGIGRQLAAVGKQHASSGLIAAVVICLGALPTLAQAIVTPPTASFSVTSTPGGTPGAYTLTYVVTNTTPSSSSYSQQLTQIELPELSAGDLTFNPTAYNPTPLPADWEASESSAQQIASAQGAYVYGDSTASYVDLQLGDGNGIFPGGSLTFVANVPRSATVGAQFSAMYYVDSDDEFFITQTAVDDPLTVGRAAAATQGVPEPAPIASLGIGCVALILAGRRRRRPVARKAIG